MTLQLAVRCVDGAYVLVSDTKVRRPKPGGHVLEFPTEPGHQPKVAIDSVHEIAVAMAGEGSMDGPDEATDLANELSTLPTEQLVDCNLHAAMVTWGNRTYRKRRPHSRANDPTPILSMLVINPRSEYCAMNRLHVNYESDVPQLETRGYMANGNDNVARFFWPEFLKADRFGLSLEDGTAAAIMTILMAGQIGHETVYGLDVYQYMSPAWTRWTPHEMRGVSAHPSAPRGSNRLTRN